MKEPLAKPSGITLQQHIKNVLAEGIYIHNTLPISFQKYSKTVNKDLFKRLNGAIKFHDDGKLHTKWQNACRNDYEEFLKWHSLTGKNFNEYSKYFKDLAGKNLRNSGVRHEINSLTRHISDGFSNPVKVAIAAHHSKLGRRFEDRWTNNNSGEKSSDLWNEFINLNFCFKKNFHDFKNAIISHYEFSGVRAYLQLADRRASAKEDNGIYIPFQSFEYNFPFDEKRNVQKIVEDHLNEDFLLVRAPTGSGKTDASLLWASSQIKNQKAERLVIAMPTRFTSNALSINVAESLSETGLYHSSAWNSKFHKQVKKGFLKKEVAKKEHELARQLLMPITICTIDHLLMALTLTMEDHHSIMFNLANSCVVIDEADFYDEFTQANILVLLEALNVLKVPVMVMSASLPESSLSMYQSTGYKVEKIHEDTSDNKRIRCLIDDIIEYDELSEIEDQLQACLDKGCAIIYANTVAKAMSFYRWFEQRNVEPILYHSRFTEPDKAKKEELLLSALGKDAWKTGTAKGIIIMTQIGEMSVNISADLMLSDLCPIDRLVQRVGRLCRFSIDKIGILKLLIPQKEESLYPAPYGTFIQKNGWLPNKALVKTQELLKAQEYSAGNFVDLINEVYPSFEKFQMKTKHNAELLKSKLVNNWIILPLESAKEDDTESSGWKSRDITANETVFVDFPESDYFNNWADFMEYKLEFGIDLPIYLIRKGVKNTKVITHKIHVGENNSQNIYIALNCYSERLGLQIDSSSSKDQFL